jgi:hypothetical protein
VGAVPYQALPLLRFFMCNIRAREKKIFKVRKGEGELGNEATYWVPFFFKTFMGSKLITKK